MRNEILKTIIQAADNADVELEMLMLTEQSVWVTLQCEMPQQQLQRNIRCLQSKVNYQYFYNQFLNIKNSEK
jgi:hypothetical protein